LLDLNTAGKEELMSINGIGPVLSARIIAGRPYRTVDDLLKVKGIGPKNLKIFALISSQIKNRGIALA
jgi:DNA uptake protein and related DNA-binding proteins